MQVHAPFVLKMALIADDNCMIINKKQLEQFDKLNIEKFVTLTLAFLKDNFKDWIAGKDETELRNFIIRMTEWAAKYNIHAGINIQKLIHYKIEYGWDIPLHKKLEAHLKDSHSETARVESFCVEVMSKRYKLIQITLDSDLKKPGIEVN
jgi:hypothetical protein